LSVKEGRRGRGEGVLSCFRPPGGPGRTMRTKQDTSPIWPAAPIPTVATGARASLVGEAGPQNGPNETKTLGQNAGNGALRPPPCEVGATAWVRTP